MDKKEKFILYNSRDMTKEKLMIAVLIIVWWARSCGRKNQKEHITGHLVNTQNYSNTLGATVLTYEAYSDHLYF